MRTIKKHSSVSAPFQIPAYQRRPTLARNLGISEEEVNRRTETGELPTPVMLPDGEPRWSWEKSRPPDPPNGIIYVVGFSHYVKIGYTTKFDSRLSALQTYAPEKLTIYATIKGMTLDDEDTLHQRFASYHSNGEWFRKEGELDSWINCLTKNTKDRK